MAVFGMVSLASSLPYTLVGLNSFFTNTKLESEDEVFVFDNDQSFPLVQPFLPPLLKIVTNERPRSFSANINQAIDLAIKKRTDLYFLNNDLYFPPEWIEPIRNSPPEAIASPLSNREIILKTGEIQWINQLQLSDFLGREKLIEKGVKELISKNSGYKKVISLPFFCVKLPLRIMEKVGKFDEGFGRGGGEDYDYCIRSIRHGFSIAYAAGSYVLHFNGKSTWSGADSAEENARRCETYRRYFREKWGERLFRLYIGEDPSIIDELGFSSFAKNGDFSALIEKLIT
jgi:GT2 family glycosyltransferase